MANVSGTDNPETLNAVDGVTNGADVILGLGGNDTIFGLGGNDEIKGGGGADSLDGGSGTDIASYIDSAAGVVVSLAPEAVGSGGTAQGDTLVSIESLSGSGHDDFLAGDDGVNVLSGLAGADTLKGGGGADTLQGGDGGDNIRGGSGADLIEGGSDDDTIRGDAGSDSIDGGINDDTIFGDDGDNAGGDADQINGSHGDDLIFGEGGDDVIFGDALNTAPNGEDEIHGGDGNDTIYGDDTATVDPGKADTLFGDAGDDIIRGGDGGDNIRGGSGADLIEGEADADTIRGDAGSDTIDGGVNDDTIFGDDGDNVGGDADQINGSHGDDLIFGEGGDDVIFGDALNTAPNGEDEIHGGDGNDTIYGDDTGTLDPGRADTLFGDAGNDTLVGGQGNDQIDGGSGSDTASYETAAAAVTVDLTSQSASGAHGIDTLTSIENAAGGEGHDTLVGNAGANTLIGRGGNDTLDGEGGNDTFRYDDGQGAGDGEFIVGGAGTDRLLMRAVSSATFDFRGFDVSSIEEIEFGADGVNIDKTAIFSAEEFDSSAEFSPTLRIDGNAIAGSTEAIEIEMGAVLSLDISGWTFQDWGGEGELITINGDGGNESITGSSQDDRLNGFAGDDMLEGLGGDDSIFGSAGFDSLIGAGGNDTLDGGTNPAAQGDILLGGLGNDVYHVDHGLDLVDEGIVFGGAADGVDEIISHADFFWDFYSAGDVLRLAENAIDPEGDGATIVGSVFSNFVVGNSKTNVLFGRGGSDTYIAGDGIDFMSLSTLGLTDGNSYAGVDGVNTVIVEQRTSGANSYDIVFEFETGKDKLDVSDYGFASAAAAFATGVNDGAGNCYFILGDGLDYLYMVGLELADMSAGDFIV